MDQHLRRIGFGITAVYMLLVAKYSCLHYSDIISLTPENIGNFLGGVFGPLALAWLILGFYQQGIELKQNTEALRLQVQELAESVKQQTELVAVTREQVHAADAALEFERKRYHKEIQPELKIVEDIRHFREGEIIGLSLKMANMGHKARNIVISFDPPSTNYSPTELGIWESSSAQSIEWGIDRPISPITTGIIMFLYQDQSGMRHKQRFKWTLSIEGIDIKSKIEEIKPPSIEDLRNL